MSCAIVFEISPSDNIITATNALQPGDILELTTGEYITTSRFGVTLDCSAALPCIIRAKSGHSPHVHRPNASQNIMDIENSRYVTFEGIEFSGGSRGLRLNNSSFIRLIDNHIHDTGDAAITANDSNKTYEGLTIVHNHIHDTNGTGEGMYLGCNSNGCQVFNSLIANNYIHHTNGASVSQGDGIELKEGSYGNIIRDNVIHDTGYPCLLTYSTVGNGAANIVERNVMWACGDHAIQSAADTIIRNNIILGSTFDGIHCQPHQNGVPSNLEITHNTILNTNGSVIRISNIAGAVTIANNALYSQSGVAIRVGGDLSDLTVSNNSGKGSLIGISNGFDNSGSLSSDFVNASFTGVLPQNVFPKTASLLINSADSSFNAVDDFNLSSRIDSLDAGAYRYDINGNSGWIITQGFKSTDEIFTNSFENPN
jgi:hypothetical protein